MLHDALLLMLETYREEASGSSKTARGRYPRDPKRVKRRDLLRHLRAHDCELLREGALFLVPIRRETRRDREGAGGTRCARRSRDAGSGAARIEEPRRTLLPRTGATNSG